MRLNIGCGNHYANGWVNVDIDSTDDVHPDVVADVTAGLPFPDGLFYRIYLGHVLEHIDQAAVPRALGECRRLLASGGVIAVVGPDCDCADRMLATGEINGDERRKIVEGAGRWAHDVHLWRCTGDVVAGYLEAAGFAATRVEVRDLVNTEWPLVADVTWQFAMFATVRGGVWGAFA